MTTNSVNSITPAQAPPAAAQSGAQPTGPGIDKLANEQTFLQLLVAQIRNQDPLQPQDGIQFVAQLAQFSSLEQEIQMRQDLDLMSKSAGSATSGGTTPTSQT